MFTGLQPWEHGVTRNGQVLNEANATVAEYLQEAGFETHAVVASFPLAARFGYSQGFDEFHAEFDRSKATVRPWEGEWSVPDRKFYAIADSVTRLAIAALETARGRRQFFWFHYFDPHSPYGESRGGGLDRKAILAQIALGKESPEEVLRNAQKLYDMDLDFLDRSLEQLFQRFEKDEDEFETHVLVVSDHGESFGEAGALGHGSRLTPEQIHVPAFILSPRLEPGLRMGIASSVDVLPTLLALAGVADAREEPRGRNLADLDTPPRAVFGMRRTYLQESWRETRIDGQSYELKPYWFYALDRENQLFRGNREGIVGPAGGSELGTLSDIAALFAGFEERYSAEYGTEAAMDSETRQALEALGYAP